MTTLRITHEQHEDGKSTRAYIDGPSWETSCGRWRSPQFLSEEPNCRECRAIIRARREAASQGDLFA